MSRPDEYQPCQKANGELRIQKWDGTQRWRGQTYHRWVCDCESFPKKHLNRVYQLTAGNTRAMRLTALAC
jgi:hypothetical protein